MIKQVFLSSKDGVGLAIQYPFSLPAHNNAQQTVLSLSIDKQGDVDQA
jgi:hypothetical protein